MPPANPNSLTSIIQSIDPDEYSTLFQPPVSSPARRSPPLEDFSRGRFDPSEYSALFHNRRSPPRIAFSGYTRPPPLPSQFQERSRTEVAEEADRRRRLPRLDIQALGVREVDAASATTETSTGTPNSGTNVLVDADTTTESSESEDGLLRNPDYRLLPRHLRGPGVLPEPTFLSRRPVEASERLGLYTATLDTVMPPRRRSTSTAATNGATATSSRPSRRRNATQALGDEGSEADHEGNINPVSGPSRKRRNDANANGQASTSRTNEPIVIDDLDDEVAAGGEDTTAQRLQETLQKQREEAVKSQQAASEMPKLSKLQCVICMDSFTDMTATSCGHIFCHECLISALRASENRRFAATGVHGKRSQCPVCRTTLSRSKAGDLIPLLILKKGLATQPTRARVG